MFIHAGFVLAVIVAAFGVAKFLRLNTELSMLAGAVAGAVAHFHGLPVRHLVEGAFTYFDVCLIFLTATFFMNLLKEAGGIAFIVRWIVRTFHARRSVCLLLLTLVMLVPGALTGSGAATVLTVGTLVGSVLLTMGVSAAPPINLWAMMAAAGANMPYVGFMLPLLVLSVTGALLSMFLLAGKGDPIDLDSALATLPEPPAGMSWGRVLLPFGVLFGLVVAGRLFPFRMPILGLPLIFLLSAVAVLLTSPVRLRVFDVACTTTRSLMPLVGIMVVVGVLIQVMAASGSRGLISLAVVTLPLGVLFCTLFLILPISEGAVQYAAAPLLGVPLIMLFNMKGMDPVIALSAMAVMWPLGDCLPPTAVVGRAVVMELDYKGRYYGEFLKACLVPAALISLLATLFLVFSKNLAFLVGG